jgi:molecular chaperone GrpE
MIYNATCMVNEKNDDYDMEIDVTNEDNGEDIELLDEELSGADKIKTLRKKLSVCEADKKTILDDAQRSKADFLNARKRLEEDRINDRLRAKKQHIEELLPLCDSFEMAMSNKEAWEKADKAWRSGVEGIYSQLQRLLESYGVTIQNPLGESFSPHKHEALGTEAVSDSTAHDTVVRVIQSGYEITHGDKTDIIRPARVITGTYTE